MKKDIKPVWQNYREWEEFKKGMYENRQEEEKIQNSYNILTSRFLKNYMHNTTNYLPISTRVHFTNKMFNPVSWLGQATCCIHGGSVAQETCIAWLRMEKEQQDRANGIAREVIQEWRDTYEDIQ